MFSFLICSIFYGLERLKYPLSEMEKTFLRSFDLDQIYHKKNRPNNSQGAR
jgi:hypothetical protein